MEREQRSYGGVNESNVTVTKKGNVAANMKRIICINN